MSARGFHLRRQRHSSKIRKKNTAYGLIVSLLVILSIGTINHRSIEFETLECGYPGISRVECELLGCDFNADLSCRSPQPMKPTGFTCSIDLSKRSNCGYPLITEEACTNLQCCFQNFTCYFPGAVVPQFPSITEQRIGPMFSIILACYAKDAEFLPNALQSVVLQSYRHWEAIVVDDGSAQHECMEVADSFIGRLSLQHSKQFRTLYKKNGFIADARNYAIERAAGTFILPVDADDYLGPTFLSEAVHALQQDSDLELLYADQYFFGVKTSCPHWYLWKNMRLQSALERGPLPVTTIYTKDLWLRVGGYKLDMIFGNETIIFGWTFCPLFQSPKKFLEFLAGTGRRYLPCTKTQIIKNLVFPCFVHIKQFSTERIRFV